MASFTERATLEVKDKSTAQIRKINAELKKLQQTANSLKSIKISISGIPLARKQVQGLTRDLHALKRAASALNIKVGVQGVTAAQRQLNNLRNSARRPINVRMNYTGQRPPPLPPNRGGPPGGGQGRGGSGRRSFMGTALQGANAGMGGGMGFGLMGGLAAINPAFLAVAAAAYAAAAALKFIGTQGAKSDRADLMMRMAATTEQQPIIQKAVDAYAASPHAMGMSKADMKMFITGILGDVGGKNATERATAAANIAPQIADKFLPLAYALGGPDVTKESAIKDLAVIVKGLNIASGDLTNAAGQFTKDGQRVFEGVALAKAMNPLLDSERIRTTLANLKTMAFTMSPESLATLLSSSGDRGVRVANELYQASRSLSGVVDNKALNKALAGMGLLTGGKPILTPSGKVKKGGGIEPGSGTPVESELLRTNPYQWIINNVLPKVMEQTTKTLTKAEIKAADERAKIIKDEGGTAEEIAAARAPLRSKLQSVMDQMFPGMPASSRTALSDAIYSEGQQKGSIAQGKDVLKQNAADVFDKSWTAQLDKLRTTIESKAQDLGTAAAEGIGLAGRLKKIDDAIRTGDFDKKQAALSAAEDLLKIVTTPSSIAGELLYKGSTLLIEGAQALVNWFKGDKDPQKDKDLSTLRESPEARKLNDVRALIDRARARIEIAATAVEDARRKGDERGVPAAIKDITRGRAVITTMSAQIGDFHIPKGWGVDKPEMFPTPSTTRKKDQQGVFPDPKKTGATSTAELQKLFGEVQTSTASWLSTVSQGPGEFEKAFGTLNQKALDAGTGLGTNAGTSLSGQAPGIGQVIGNSAATAIKAAVSNLNINVNANVSGGSKGGDTGQTARGD
jgi:hypothetical protein